jgi:hypothetical protein
MKGKHHGIVNRARGTGRGLLLGHAGSDPQNRVQELIASIVGVINSIKKPFAPEVFLRREPTDDEFGPLMASIVAFCSAEHPADTPAREEIPGGMGLLFLNDRPVGHVVIDNHGEDPVPRLGAARAIVGPGAPNRHVAVRVPYADARAEQFLTTEARQLPTDAPGLVMVEMARAPGGFRSWEPLLRRRFQPAIHTRVGAICLFSSGLFPTDAGEAALFEAKVITNDHARMPLPPWIEATCAAVHHEFEARTQLAQE